MCVSGWRFTTPVVDEREGEGGDDDDPENGHTA